jgi:antitoxin ParD1/3/4
LPAARVGRHLQLLGVAAKPCLCYDAVGTPPEILPVPTRNVVLTEHNVKMIEDLVRSGRYQNASEVLREGLRLIEQREAVDAAKLQTLREAARIGMAAFERGDYRSFESFEELERHLIDLGDAAITERSGR